jgi:hypothetical protein
MLQVLDVINFIPVIYLHHSADLDALRLRARHIYIYQRTTIAMRIEAAQNAEIGSPGWVDSDCDSETR